MEQETKTNTEYAPLKELSIVIYKATNKTNENQPDYWGKAMINGVEMKYSGWINESKNGTKYINGKLQNYQEKPAAVSDKDDADAPF